MNGPATLPEQSRLSANPRTLAAALAAILEQRGAGIDVNVFSLALGNPFLICSVGSEPDIALWPMYARDAFLIEAGRLFGMTIREMHPPRAAVGLRESAEFFQHFDASYRPLIMRALEHDQPVLAWRGWAGELEPCWGIIRGTCSSTIGFTGSVYALPGLRKPQEIELSSAPVQYYVVESCRPVVPTPELLLHHLSAVARVALSNGIADRFAVRTGPPAFAEVCSAAVSATQKQVLEFVNACMCEVDVAKWLLGETAPIPTPGLAQAAEVIHNYCHELSACLRVALGKPDPPAPVVQWTATAASIAASARDALFSGQA